MVIDLGNVDAWPAPAVAHVDHWIQRLDGKGAGHASDDAEDKLRAMFAGHRILGYHCTRLLDHEIAAIKADGMQLHYSTARGGEVKDVLAKVAQIATAGAKVISIDSARRNRRVP